jgi:thioredoxin reductase
MQQQTSYLKSHQIKIVEDGIEELGHESGNLQNIKFKNGRSENINVLYAKIPFVQHSDIPALLGCELTPEGYIKTDPSHKTSVTGVFACGDNVTRMRTVANAVAMGTTTGMMVNKTLIEEEFLQPRKHIL